VLIHTENLSKIYGVGDQVVHALDSVSIDIDSGDFVAIVGASGSGKSTFMNMIGCLDQPSNGRYFLAGEDVASLDPDSLADIRNRRIGFVFQQFNLLNRTSAIENTALPLLYARSGPLAGLSKEERLDHAKKRLEQVGLGDRLDNMPNQLSGGQQQRVAIARALVNDPDLILADEPTGNIASAQAEEIMAIFQELNKNGHTIVMITHEPDIAAHAKRVLSLRDGKIISDVLNKKQIMAKKEEKID
jgi:putative ABC transport system ATP-binding protein